MADPFGGVAQTVQTSPKALVQRVRGQPQRRPFRRRKRLAARARKKEDPHPWVQALGEHSAGFVRQFGVWQAGSSLNQNEKPTRELAELLCIAKQADEASCGDLIWYSWSAHDNKATASPSYGSFMIGLTKNGARRVKTVLEEEKPYHIDCMLLDALKNKKIPNACYVHPTVGNFCSHPSHIIKGTRPTVWEKKWCAEGVAPVQGQDHKHLYTFEKKGKRRACVPSGLVCLADDVANSFATGQNHAH